MYKKGSKGWLKHFDFILLDMICLQIAFLLAYVIRHDSGSPYIVPLYRNMAIFMELLDIIVMFFYETLSNVLKRGYFREFAVTVKHVLLVELFSVLYLFTMQEGQAYSRTALYLTGVIYAILTYIVRIIWKKFALIHAAVTIGFAGNMIFDVFFILVILCELVDKGLITSVSPQ